MIVSLVFALVVIAWVVSSALLYAYSELTDDWVDSVMMGAICAMLWPIVLLGFAVWLVARRLVDKLQAIRYRAGINPPGSGLDGLLDDIRGDS